MNTLLFIAAAPNHSILSTPSAPLSGVMSHLPALFQGPQSPQPHQAPLHDIIGPFSFFAYTPTQVVLALLLLFLVLGMLFWGLKKLRQKPQLSLAEACLQKLLAIKENLMEGNDHDFGILVSGLLRDYLGALFGLAAPRQTTEEFIASLRGHGQFTQDEQQSLEMFLVRSDFLKFADGKASQSDRLALVMAAEHFVRAECAQKLTVVAHGTKGMEGASS